MRKGMNEKWYQEHREDTGYERKNAYSAIKEGAFIFCNSRNIKMVNN